MTAEEMLAAYLSDKSETLAHYNPYHDPNTGQFASKNGGRSAQPTKPIKDKPGSFEEAKEKGLIKPADKLTVTTVSTKPSTKSQKEINKFNNKAMGLVDKISDRAQKASGLYMTSMAMAKKGVAENSRAYKNTAGMVYERAMANRKRMNKYIDKLTNMGVKFRSDEVDYVNFQHLAAGEGFVKRAMASRIADYIVPFYGYAHPSDYKINEEFVKSVIK